MKKTNVCWLFGTIILVFNIIYVLWLFKDNSISTVTIKTQVVYDTVYNYNYDTVYIYKTQKINCADQSITDSVQFYIDLWIYPNNAHLITAAQMHHILTMINNK